MKVTSVEIQSSLSVREQADLFRTTASQLYSGRAKLVAGLRRATGQLASGQRLEFYTPEGDAFTAANDDQAAFAVGVWIPKTGGMGSGRVSIQLFIWDRGNSRDSSFRAPLEMGGAGATRKMLDEFVAVFRQADARKRSATLDDLTIRGSSQSGAVQSPQAPASPTTSGPELSRRPTTTAIVAYLTRRDMKHTITSDGRVQLVFAAKEPSPQLTMFYGVNSAGVMWFAGTAKRSFASTDERALLAACNAWNREKQWPMAYVVQPKDDTTIRHVQTSYALVPAGEVAQRTVDLFVSTMNSAAISFWDALTAMLWAPKS